MVQQQQRRFFAPQKFECEIISERKGKVIFENQTFDTNLLNPEVIDHNVPNKTEPYADQEILKNLAPIRARFDNYAITKESEFINNRMTSFGKQMPKTIYEPVKDKAFLMSGWQLTSTLIVVGDNGLIVVDPGESDEASERILNDFRKETNIQFPVKAVVYTHRHPDHSFGSAGMGVTQEQVDNGDVKIFAHYQFMDYLANDASVVGSILTERTAYGGASYLGQNEKGLVHAGLGPTFAGGKISFYRPTDIVKDKLQTEVAGVKMVLFEAYGDAEDEIDVTIASGANSLTTVAGNLNVTGSVVGKMTQFYSVSFLDDLNTTEHFLPWKDINEQTTVYQEEAAMIMPYDGRIKSVTMRMSSVAYTANRTLKILTFGPNSAQFTRSAWHEEETETISITGTDDNHVFHFVFDNAKHFESGELVSIAIQDSADLHAGYRYCYVTVEVEFDMNNGLGTSTTSAEYDSAQ